MKGKKLTIGFGLLAASWGVQAQGVGMADGIASLDAQFGFLFNCIRVLGVVTFVGGSIQMIRAIHSDQRLSGGIKAVTFGFLLACAPSVLDLLAEDNPSVAGVGLSVQMEEPPAPEASDLSTRQEWQQGGSID